MISPRRTERAFLLTWCILVACTLVGVTSDLSALEKFKLEQLSMIGVAAFTPLIIWQKRSESLLDREFLSLWVPGLLFVVFLFHAEFYQLNPAKYLYSSQIRHTAKAFVLIPLVWMVLRTAKDRDFVLTLLASGITILCAWSLLAWHLGYMVKSSERLILATRHGDPNFLSTYAGATLLVWAHIFATHNRLILRFLAIVGAGVLIALIMAGGSRMGMLSLLLGGVFVAAFEARKRQKLMPLVIAGATIALLGALGIVASDRFADFTVDRSIHERFLSIEAGWQAFSQRPLTGWGVRTTASFFYRFSEYPLFEAEMSALDLHNTWLQCLAELGVFAFVSYTALWCISFWRVMRSGSAFLGGALVVAILGMNAIPGTYDDILPLFPLLLGLVFTKRDYWTTSI